VAVFVGDLGHRRSRLALEPIVAWMIRPSSPPSSAQDKRRVSAIPITVHGSFYHDSSTDICAIKTPDGHFCFVGDRALYSEDEALADCRELQDAEDLKLGQMIVDTLIQANKDIEPGEDV
jgi:hypothetical protein